MTAHLRAVELLSARGSHHCWYFIAYIIIRTYSVFFSRGSDMLARPLLSYFWLLNTLYENSCLHYRDTQNECAIFVLQLVGLCQILISLGNLNASNSSREGYSSW